MDKKKILIGLGVLAAAGIGFYFWNKSKKPAEVGETDSTTGVAEVKKEGGSESSSEVSNIPTTREEAENLLLKAKEKIENRLACGKKPILKKNRARWQNCIDKGGMASFDGSYYFEGLAEIKQENIIREKSFAEQVINREDGRMFAGNVYDN
jgi:hypothetical protein